MRRQHRKAQHKGLRVPRPHANPTTFGHLTTMDHWLAMDDLSRGDRVRDFSRPGDRFHISAGCARQIHDAQYCYTDGSRELAMAYIEFKIAHDPAIPGIKKLMVVAERSNGYVQMGTRALLMQAGHPPPFWTCAVRYFCLCFNARKPANGESSWRRRFGHEFAAPLLPFGSLVRSMPLPESMFRIAKTGGAVVAGIYLGY
eukprot:1128733-Pyramimonas_sp.AAC.1